MVLSSLLVARLILWDRDSIDPRIVVFRSNQPSIIHHTVFANSITLTPGTLTVDLQGDQYLVHAICARTENDLLNGPMARKVARLSGLETDPQPVRIPLKAFGNR
jgi:multicomponent Na+:H+ antiporter subunit E